MDASANPLCAPELLDQYLGFVDDPDALTICARVARPWCYLAQSHLFREIDLTGIESSERLQMLVETLGASLEGDPPGLIRHIQRLHIDIKHLPNPVFSAFCALPFTQLKFVLVRNLTVEYAITMKQLFKLGSHPHVSLDSLVDPRVFQSQWDSFFPGIQHLQLSHLPLADPYPEPASAPAGRVRIVSLGLSVQSRSPGLEGWLNDARCPLDLSSLKLFSVLLVPWPSHAGQGMPHSSSLPQQTSKVIKVLDCCVSSETPTFDLSSCPKLVLLRISVITGGSKQLLPILLTIPKSSSIRKIIISELVEPLDAAICTAIDTELMDRKFNFVPTIELEMDFKSYSECRPHFPKFSSMKKNFSMEELKRLVRIDPAVENVQSVENAVNSS
ncbi:hypothetical protein FB451DRAFT_1164101 [Mycena latifolia]|nr:hypothetical protein FB451DRAFT_1164101 [Mycena latifolia]